MPAPGDQHINGGRAIENPFLEAKPQVAQYTAQQIATLQARLEKKLGPEYISQRANGKGKVGYVEAHKCIELANEVFGFNGWSSTIKEVQVDFVDEVKGGRWSMGLSVVLRVTLRDGTFHEDIGYGHCENFPNKAQAFEKSKKEGTTDALKRALRNFGNVLGNCIYDKTYMKEVAKIKVEPKPFKLDDSLHRHKSYQNAPQPKFDATTTEETVKVDPEEDDYGFSDFEIDELMLGVGDTEGHPDEVTIEVEPSKPSRRQPQTNQNNNNNQQRSGNSTNSSGGNAQQNQRQVPSENKPLPRPPVPAPNQQPPSIPPKQPQNAQPQTPKPLTRSNSVAQNPLPNPPQQPVQPRKLNQPSRAGAPAVVPAIAATSLSNSTSLPNIAAPPKPVPITADPDFAPPPGGISVGFFSGRAVQSLTQSNDVEMGGLPAIPVVPDRSMAFNPHSESPSIRKTPGVDHSSTRPQKSLHKLEDGSEVPESPSLGGNKYVAPATRGMGMGNRGGFKKPTFTGKRPVTATGAGGGDERAVLQDMNANGKPNGGVNSRGGSVEPKHAEQQQQQGNGHGVKRPRLSGP